MLLSSPLESVLEFPGFLGYARPSSLLTPPVPEWKGLVDDEQEMLQKEAKREGDRISSLL